MLRSRLLAAALLTASLAAAGCAGEPTFALRTNEAAGSLAADATTGPPVDALSAGAGGAPASEAGAASSPTLPATTIVAPRSIQGGTVTAGSVDDNERFDDYLAYRATATKAGLHDVDVTGRRVIRVRGAGGRPVLGARVRVGDGPRPLLDARTHSDGRVLFLPRATEGAGAGPWPVTVDAGGARASATLTADGPELVVTAGPEVGDPGKLDVVFLLDATGSMGDELDRLTANMASTASKVLEAAGGSQVRFGLTAFKDRGDDYVTRSSPLTSDVRSFSGELAKVKAGGGGDTPESVSAGLNEAVTKSAWGGDDVAKVIVLVGDAAPHTDYRDEPSYAADARAAADRGIRIHAIASSGLSDQGEYAFRQMAQLSAGRFVFLTYGADGGPGGSTPHQVDKYAVKSLDELVATLLVEELRPGRQTQ